METELVRVWQLVSELSEQLARNQELASSLKNQAGVLKVSGCISYNHSNEHVFFPRAVQTSHVLAFRCAGSMLIYPKVCGITRSNLT
jgi:hypothetical protein